jgi:hypothetical protein
VSDRPRLQHLLDVRAQQLRTVIVGIAVGWCAAGVGVVTLMAGERHDGPPTADLIVQPCSDPADGEGVSALSSALETSCLP